MYLIYLYLIFLCIPRISLGSPTLSWSSTSRQKLDGSSLTGQRYRYTRCVSCYLVQGLLDSARARKVIIRMCEVHAANTQVLFNCAVMQVVKNTLNPTWRPFRIPLQSLCGGDVEKSIKVQAHSHTEGIVTHDTAALSVFLCAVHAGVVPETQAYTGMCSSLENNLFQHSENI